MQSLLPKDYHHGASNMGHGGLARFGGYQHVPLLVDISIYRLGDPALNDGGATAGRWCPQNGLKPFGLAPAAMSLRERRCATALSAVKLPKLRETRKCGGCGGLTWRSRINVGMGQGFNHQ